jgi:uncharacterized RDD family membrane protein YckC
MTTTQFRQFAAIALLVIGAVSEYLFLPARSIEASIVWKNGETTVTGSSSPAAVFWSGLGIIIFIALMLTAAPSGNVSVPRWWRRVLARVIDFCVAVMSMAGISALVPLGLEALRTGHFVWAFERYYSVRSDGITLVLAFLDLGVLVLYFVFPLTRGKQTVGCFVMRIRVTPPSGTEGRLTWRAAFRRVWLEVRAFGLWTSLFNPKRDADGNTSWDLETGCRVVLVDYTTSP